MGLGPRGTRGYPPARTQAQSLDRGVLGVSFRQPFENSWAESSGLPGLSWME